jgi:signal transduction histidine kinase/CheY-like chemotaxis protein
MKKHLDYIKRMLKNEAFISSEFRAAGALSVASVFALIANTVFLIVFFILGFPILIISTALSIIIYGLTLYFIEKFEQWLTMMVYFVSLWIIIQQTITTMLMGYSTAFQIYSLMSILLIVTATNHSIKTKVFLSSIPVIIFSLVYFVFSPNGPIYYVGELQTVWLTTVNRSAVILIYVFVISLYYQRYNRSILLLNKKSMELEKALSSKSDFLAMISHEIRTPLNGIIGISELLGRTELSPKQKNYAMTISSSSQSLLYLINQILDFSKIESGKETIEIHSIDLLDLISDVMLIAHSKAEIKAIDINFVVNPETIRYVSMDFTKIRQILHNLLDNAIKFTDTGSVTFSIDYHWIDSVTMILDMKVIDTGVGISQTDLNMIYGQFTQLKTTKNKAIQGSGLGLAITKRLVELLGGSIEVSSTLGVGTQFDIKVPVTVNQKVPIGEMNWTKLTINEKSNISQDYCHDFGNYQVLIVDDNPVNLMVIEEYLLPYGMKVLTADNGLKAIEVIQKNGVFDMIFLDHMMPIMDGIEAIQKIRQMNILMKNIPIVAFTANAVVSEQQKFIDAGFDDILYKPISALNLEAIVLKYLTKK